MSTAKIAFLFHMHQPYYIDMAENRAVMPWVRLHGIKGYFDIPYLIGKLDGTKITVNLVPSLIEQLFLYRDKKISDLYLDLTLKPVPLLTEEERLFLIDNFFSVNRKNFIEPNPNYKRLMELRGDSDDRDELRKRLAYFRDSDLNDLKALFNLSWFGFGARKEFPEIERLIAKGRGYTEEDIRLIIDIQFKVLSRIIPMYKKLLDEGKIELSISPYFHPILPLIIDSDIGKVALPDKPFPPRFSHPEHARMHIAEGIRLFKEVFGREPSGMWPSEGSVSNEALELISEFGIKWIATDEGVLVKSGFEYGNRLDYLYNPYIFRDKLYCFFRDRELSDRIGFVYYNMKPDNAVQDFLNHVKAITRYYHREDPVISVIFDGENPWEFYENSGEEFLFALFDGIKKSDFAETCTFSEIICSSNVRKLDSIWPGSWINSNFAIWIGHHETNTAWSYLGRAVDFFEKKSKDGSNKEGIEKAKKEIMVAEGSDWFWWYGDDFRVKGQDRFDLLFLKHLTNVYRFLGEEEPVYLRNPIKKPESIPKPDMPLSLISPDIDGVITNFFEWSGAGSYTPTGKGGAMFEGQSIVKRVMFGQDYRFAYFLIELRENIGNIKVLLQDNTLFSLNIDLQKGIYHIPVKVYKNNAFQETGFKAQVGVNKVVELKVPGELFDFKGRDTLKFALQIEGRRAQRIPQFGFVETGITFPPLKKFLMVF